MVMLCRQKDTDAARRKKTGRPIFRTIFSAMMLVMQVEVVLLAVSITITNVDGTSTIPFLPCRKKASSIWPN